MNRNACCLICLVMLLLTSSAQSKQPTQPHQTFLLIEPEKSQELLKSASETLCKGHGLNRLRNPSWSSSLPEDGYRYIHMGIDFSQDPIVFQDKNGEHILVKCHGGDGDDCDGLVAQAFDLLRRVDGEWVRVRRSKFYIHNYHCGALPEGELLTHLGVMDINGDGFAETIHGVVRTQKGTYRTYITAKDHSRIIAQTKMDRDISGISEEEAKERSSRECPSSLQDITVYSVDENGKTTFSSKASADKAPDKIGVPFLNYVAQHMLRVEHCPLNDL